MDALRLLSRSTALKLPTGERPGKSGNPKQRPQSDSIIPVHSKKRKRLTENAELDTPTDTLRHSPRSVPHNGDTNSTNESAGTSVRGTTDVSTCATFSSAPLPADQRHSIFRQHRVKITDLRILRDERSKLSKKVQKGAAAILTLPMLDFRELDTIYNINKLLSQNVAEQGFHHPTEVQLASMPLLLGCEGQQPDLITVAPTGSGKTLAFLVPLVNKISNFHREVAISSSRHTRAVILAPTKELVDQIVTEGRKLTSRTGVTISAMRKGMRLYEHGAIGNDESSDLNNRDEKPIATLVKSDIIVSTPLSVMNAASGQPLHNITTLVLDEADVLLDPLFRDQTLAVWNACTSPALRTSLWSATIGSNIEAVAISTMESRLQTPSSPVFRVVIGLKDSTLPHIHHKLVYAANEPGKLVGLRYLVHPPSSLKRFNATSSSSTGHTNIPHAPFLVFTQTIERAAALAHELTYDVPVSAVSGPRVAVLHASLSSTQRSDIMTRFRKGQIWVLITTDLLSRGVDFRGIDTVVNYDIPGTVAAYVHRAGRTGRLAPGMVVGAEATRKGTCVTFYTKADIKYVRGIANLIDKATRRDQQSHQSGDDNRAASVGVEQWLLDALPTVSKKDRKDLKEKGVDVRRALRKDVDEEKLKRAKRKARLGTSSGYDQRRAHNFQGAVKGSRHRKHPPAPRQLGAAESDEWVGISD